ncbi:MAG TPA: ABC transporter substrate-binding protein [Azospirillum sp.]|nr:ABC transporter substrate-binding protein [Azospirillum sp.]
MRTLLAATAALALVASSALAQTKPKEIVVGITTYLSGPASVFGVPGRDAADLLIEEINAKGGIGGVPVRPIYIDEGAGTENLLSEYRRVSQAENAAFTLAAISSGNCNALVPVAEDLKQPNIMWDCGTQQIFEEKRYRYSFRTQANATPEMVATVLYLLQAKPDFKTIAVVNQDYAWGRDSWNIFSNALKALKPDVRVVAEMFPKFGAPDYSTEITRLSALRPDVILSTSWGGDLDTFVRQAAARGLLKQSTFVLPLAESSLQRLGDTLPEGVIVGARGDHWFLHPAVEDAARHKAFIDKYKAKTGSYPIYPVYHMAQAIAAMQAGFDKAIKAANGAWPTREQLADAMKGLEFRGLTRTVRLREDNQGLEDQLLGTTKRVGEYPFAVLDQMKLYPAELVTTPVGQKSEEWVKTLDKGLPTNAKIQTFSYKQ